MPNAKELLINLIKNRQTIPLWTLGLLFSFFFLLLYPKTLLIADERAYTEQAYALSQGDRYEETSLTAYDILPKHYPLGTALGGAFFIWLLGSKGVFLLGGISFLIALAAVKVLLERLKYPVFWSALLFLFPPAMLLSRQVMSELPSLAILSLFFFLVFTIEPEKRKAAFVVGFLAGLSLAFRETNLLLTTPFLLGLVWKRRIHLPLLLVGGVAGLLIRFVSAELVYGNWLYLKDPGIAFGFQFLASNALIYGVALCLFIPFGLPAVFRYRGLFRQELQIALGVFILFHLFYGYNGWQASGFYAFILGPRFFIPALPLFIIAIAHGGQKKWACFKPIVITLAFLSITILQGASHHLGQSHHQIVKQLYQYETAPNYFFINSPLLKYTSSIYGKLHYEDVSQLQQSSLPNDIFHLHFLERSDTPSRQQNNTRQKQQLDFLWPQVIINKVDTVETVDKTRLLSFHLIKRNIFDTTIPLNH